MKKSEAIALLGGTVTSAASACEISTAAVSQWPEDDTGDLPKNIVDRVQAALYRMHVAKGATPAKEPPAGARSEHAAATQRDLDPIVYGLTAPPAIAGDKPDNRRDRG